MESNIYKDIAKRTGGDVYIGVVGPVRTGKSTFVHRFIEQLVLPGIVNEYDRDRTLDGLPQSATGRTVMTTEPKFIPDESVRISTDDGTQLNVKMVDCVGYLVDGALGADEEGETRMVSTPWSDKPIPFKEAAEIGTGKVINDHSTIAMLVTTDGSIADIPRENYVAAEERVVNELRRAEKPFAIILNSRQPESEEAHKLAVELENKYGAPVALIACDRMNADDVRGILGLVLGEFPIRQLIFRLPEWTEALPDNHRLKASLRDSIGAFSEKIERLGDIETAVEDFPEFRHLYTDAGEGIAELSAPISSEEYYEIVSEMTGLEIDGEGSLLTVLQELSAMREKYMKIESALRDVEEKGYGIVMPSAKDLRLEEPSLVKQAGGYGVKVSAHADSIHMIKTGIKAELCPVVGSAEQSEEVVKYLAEEFEESPERVLEYNMFGKSIYDMVSDNMNAKLLHMPDDSREKIGETLGKIINDGSNGLICILL